MNSFNFHGVLCNFVGVSHTASPYQSYILSCVVSYVWVLLYLDNVHQIMYPCHLETSQNVSQVINGCQG